MFNTKNHIKNIKTKGNGPGVLKLIHFRIKNVKTVFIHFLFNQKIFVLYALTHIER